MAKSSRASAIKKNRTAIKKKVFGPVEDARAARLNAKLLELASQPKPAREDMEIEETGKSHTSRLQSRHLEEACTNRSVPTDAATSKAAQKESSSKNAVEAEQTMDVDDEDEDDAATTASTKQRNNFRSERNEKQKKQKASRIQKGLRHRKPRNQIVFAKTGKARKGGKR